MPEQTIQDVSANDFTNYQYASRCVGVLDHDGMPDCGHQDCGLLCDVRMVAYRNRDAIKSQYAETADPEGGGDMGAAAIGELLRSGMTLRQVASCLDLPVSQVTFRIVREDHHDVLAAEELLHQGLSQHEVARRSGLRQQSVGRLEAALGIVRTTVPLRAARHGDELTAKVAKLSAKGLSLRAIADELGVPKSTVAARLRRAARRRVPLTEQVGRLVRLGA